MIKDGLEVIRQLFNASSAGMRICEIDSELLELNEFQEQYRLSDDVIREGILIRCIEYTGATAFYLQVLKNVINVKKQQGTLSSLDSNARRLIKAEFHNYDIASSAFNASFSLLKEKIFSFMKDSRFTAFCRSCEKNNYRLPYTLDDKERFFHDVLAFSKTEVDSIIDETTPDLFSYKLRRNDSPFPSDLRRTDWGDLVIHVTLTGLLNSKKIEELKERDELCGYIKAIVGRQFEVLPKESINDDSPGVTYSGNRFNSSFIVGASLDILSLYNEFLDSYRDKVMKGYIWLHDDVHGITYGYLGFHKESDMKGEYKFSIPFTNVISNYYVAYLEIHRIERDFEDLRENGYFKSKEEYSKYEEGDLDDEEEYDLPF